jgi:hypothetical protein
MVELPAVSARQPPAAIDAIAAAATIPSVNRTSLIPSFFTPPASGWRCFSKSNADGVAP